ncbi:SIR2 family protein [Peribacillus butanolivorans]|uniref:SIR2 family protein n=1 Tax=Peribacillus butanolivorans TaxID=421767 RepID=UPI0030C959BE
MSDYFVPTSIKKIKQASENNKLVVFVGAGVSANSGMPTWGQLIEEMSKDLGEFDVANTSDIYLKIPQFYFNERGEKEYFEKLNEVFLSRKYKTNPIHNEIFKLNPTHIITTNYDTLLEEAAIEGGNFYHVVRHDLDLPYDNLNKTIIKMHGDFVNKNIVLKEDDYLNYSSNFMLIENYLKSLIATNTVLFLGYSVNDPNFNLIFQWVKSILKNHFQPAYLIESSKEFSRMEHNYYKNRGINILYYDEINDLHKNNEFDESNWRGNRLFDLIKHLNSFDKSNNIDDLEYIYSRIQYLEKLNFIMPEEIVKQLKLKSVVYDLYGDKTLTCLQDDNVLIRVFSNAEKFKEKEMFKKICLIFKKANIRGVSKDKELIYGDSEENQYLSDITNGIIKADSLMVNKVTVNPRYATLDRDYFQMLREAFSYYESEKYLDSYNYYKTISLKSFQEKEYLVYYLSEFNRKHVGKRLVTFSRNFKDIETEIEELDLEDIYIKLPNKERKSLEFVKNIQNFNLIYSVQNKLNKEVEELKKTKHLVKNGGFSVNSSLNKNFNIITNIWLFIKANYLCLENYSEVQNLYRSFVEGTIASYCTEGESSSKGFFSDIKVNKIEKLNIFSVYVMITKIKTKDLERIFDEYNLKQIDLEPEALDYIREFLDNILEDILKNNKKKSSETYFYNLLTFLSMLNLESNQVELFADKLLLIFNENLYVKELKYINKFIVSAANRDALSKEVVVKYLTEYLKIYNKDKRIWEFDIARLYKNLTRIFNKEDSHELDPILIGTYIEKIKQHADKEDYPAIYELLSEIILPIINGLTENHQSIIKDIVQNIIIYIQNKEQLDYLEIKFYYVAVSLNISLSNKIINSKVLVNTKAKIANRENGIRSYPDPVEGNLNILTDLYRNGVIEDGEIEEYVSEFKGKSEYFDLIFINEEVILTDLNILSYLSDSEINKLIKSDSVRDQIYLLINNILIENQSEKIKRIFSILYLKKHN